MTLKTLIREGLVGVAALAVAALYSDPTLAQAAPPADAPAGLTVNKGDNAWMMTSSALVLFMTLPGLALFYGGLVRRKNVLSVLAQCLGCAGLVTFLWWLIGYSLVFGKGGAVAGKPIRVAPDADEDALEAARKLVQERLNEVTARAEALAGHVSAGGKAHG